MLETLRRLVQDIGDAPDLDGALALVVRWIREALAVDASAVYLVDPSDQHLVLMATEGLNPQAVGRVRLAPGEGVVGLVRKRREPVALEDALAHPSFRRFPGIGEAR